MKCADQFYRISFSSVRLKCMCSDVCYSLVLLVLSRLTWKELFEPVIQLCRDGFSLTAHSGVRAALLQSMNIYQPSVPCDVFGQKRCQIDILVFYNFSVQLTQSVGLRSTPPAMNCSRVSTTMTMGS